MERVDLISVEGEITECTSNSLYWVKLSNGHRLLAHPSKVLLKKFPQIGNQLLPGQTVVLEVRVHDLSSGRIVSMK